MAEMGAAICVVGAGVMGGQIAHQAALSGRTVALVGRSQQRAEAACEPVRASLRRQVEKGTINETELGEALGRVRVTEDLAAAAGDACVIIETVAEDRDTKRAVLRAISDVAPVGAIIGSNSSTLPSSLFAGEVRNPGRLLNIHFYNPALIMPLVEVVRGPHTEPGTVDVAVAVVSSLGKTPVVVEKESFGFLANRLLFIALVEAMHLVEDGYVSIADCDLAVRNALGWPMGPFALADLVGLDVVQAILDEGLKQTGDPRWSPPDLLRARVAQGDLGRKTGKGFIDHLRS